jgi:hypothetical protein
VDVKQNGQNGRHGAALFTIEINAQTRPGSLKLRHGTNPKNPTTKTLNSLRPRGQAGVVIPIPSPRAEFPKDRKPNLVVRRNAQTGSSHRAEGSKYSIGLRGQIPA